MNKKIRELTKMAMIAALYAVLTVVTSSISYAGVQFRVSELLILLCFYNKKYIPALTIGCLIANMFSPFGIYDVVFGTFATFISALCVSKVKNIWIASLFPSLFNGIIIALEIIYVDGLVLNLGSFTPLFLSIAFGEFVCVTILGVLVFKSIEKQEFFEENIKNI